MKNDKIVTINGQNYDVSTGLPIGKPKPDSIQEKNDIKNVHSLTHRSDKLRSNNTPRIVSDIKSPKRKISQRMDISRSKNISHFANRNTKVASLSTNTKKQMDLKPPRHSLVVSAEKKQLTNKSLDEIKKEKILPKDVKQQSTKSTTKNTKLVKNTSHKKIFFNRKSKFINIAVIVIVLLIIAGYLTYLNFPSISVRIAGVQAGIDATYPEYKPSGYKIYGPVAYTDGAVVLNFHSNFDSSKFVIKQSKSSWDSSAVKIQADKESKNETSESKEGGLTIYTYNNNMNAIWVNGGILYTISGDAKLSGEQIRHIATSL